MQRNPKTDWLDRNEYPFASHYFETDAGKLHYVDEGNGEVIVMLHGNPTWSFLYRNLIKQLGQRYRCIALDYIGFGLSDKPLDWEYLPQDHAKHLTALIEHLELKNITLVMGDWGGPIGMQYAVTNPENIKRLVITNTWAWSVKYDVHFALFSAFMGGVIGRFLIKRFNFFVNSFMYVAFGNKSKLTEIVHQHYRNALPTSESRKGCYVFPKQIIRSTSWLEKIWGQIAILKAKPTLFVWGMKDIAFRENELKRWQSALPNSVTLQLDTVGHFVAEEAPRELIKAVEHFIKKKDKQT